MREKLNGIWRVRNRLCLVIYILICYCGIALSQGNDNDNSTEVFLDECRRECAIYKNVMSCGKYRAIKWINNVVQEKEYIYGPFKIIKIPAIDGERFLPELPRTKKSNIGDTLRFIRESAEDLLTKRALVYTVEQPSGARSFSNGIMVLDDDELGVVSQSRTFESKINQGHFRIFKKKKNIILPILILLNLLKLKLLILPIFLGVHFIKKLLVLGSLLLPSVLAHLKICKIAQQPVHYHHPWAASAEYPVDYSSVYGQEDSWDHRNDVATGAYGNYYSQNMYNPFAYYFQNYYNKQQQQQQQRR